MAYRKAILAEAQQEYRDIVGYLVGVLQSKQAARNFMEEFDKQVSLVAENPELYGLSRVPELAELGYRRAPVKNYLVLYKVADGQIVVCRIIHRSRDYQPSLSSQFILLSIGNAPVAATAISSSLPDPGTSFMMAQPPGQSPYRKRGILV